MEISFVDGFAGRKVAVNQSKLNNGRVVLEIQNAKGEHCSSVVFSAVNAKKLSDFLENQAQVAMAVELKDEMAVQE